MNDTITQPQEAAPAPTTPTHIALLSMGTKTLVGVYNALRFAQEEGAITDEARDFMYHVRQAAMGRGAKSVNGWLVAPGGSR